MPLGARQSGGLRRTSSGGVPASPRAPHKGHKRESSWWTSRVLLGIVCAGLLLTLTSGDFTGSAAASEGVGDAEPNQHKWPARAGFLRHSERALQGLSFASLREHLSFDVSRWAGSQSASPVVMKTSWGKGLPSDQEGELVAATSAGSDADSTGASSTSEDATDSSVVRWTYNVGKKAGLSTSSATLGPACGNLPVDSIPNLRVEGSWQTRRESSAAQVTLVTQLSLERVEELKSQCSAWSGRIAAVVYAAKMGGRVVSMTLAPLNGTSIETHIRSLDSIHEEADKSGPCALDIQLVSEEVDSTAQAALYPVGALLNYALLLATTEVVMLLDVDCLPPMHLSQELMRPDGYAALRAALKNGTALVVPAFEPTQGGVLYARLIAQTGKEGMVSAVAGNRMQPLLLNKRPEAHFATNYTAWMTALDPYNVTYAEGYEPYVILRRADTPYFDERFRGVDLARRMHCLHLSSLVQLRVHPSAFVVHPPHTPLVQVPGAASQMKITKEEVTAAIANGAYLPVSAYTCDITAASDSAQVTEVRPAFGQISAQDARDVSVSAGKMEFYKDQAQKSQDHSLYPQAHGKVMGASTSNTR